MFYKTKRDKFCPICQKTFSTLNVRVKYCSPKCSKKSLDERAKNRNKKYEMQRLLKFGIKMTGKSKMGFKCKVCGSRFERYKSQVKYRGVGYCSVECRSRAMTNKVPKEGQLLDLWAMAVKCFDGFKCAYCGKKSYLNSHHIFSRTNKSTKYDLNNGITLCAAHHTLSSKFSAHKTPAEFIEWIKEKRGEEWYSNLRSKAKSIKKYTSEELRSIKYNFLEIKKHYDNGEFKKPLERT